MFETLNRLMNVADGEGSQDSMTVDSATQKLIDAAVSKAVANNTTTLTQQLNEKHASDTQGLVNNKTNLLEEKKKLQLRLEEIDQSKMISDGDIEGITLKAQANAKNDWEPKNTELKNQLDTANSQLYRMTSDATLEAAATKLNIKPAFKPAWKALIESEQKIEISEDRKTMTISGKPSADFFADWLKSDNANDFILSPDSSGGGANGNGSQTTSFTPSGGVDGIAAARARANNK